MKIVFDTFGAFWDSLVMASDKRINVKLDEANSKRITNLSKTSAMKPTAPSLVNAAINYAWPFLVKNNPARK